MDPGVKLLPDEGIQVTNLDQYRRLVGKLNYLAVTTRPDIFFVVSVVSRFMASPRALH